MLDATKTRLGQFESRIRVEMLNVRGREVMPASNYLPRIREPATPEDQPSEGRVKAPDPQAPSDPLADKRKRLAEAMTARLDHSYSADMPEIRNMPEFHLDYLLGHYGADVRHVY